MVKTQIPDWVRLHQFARRWLDLARKRVVRGMSRASGRKELRWRMAEYVLLATREFVDTAFEAFKGQRYHAGLTCVRTAWEFAMNIRWCRLDTRDVDYRLRWWLSKTLRDRRQWLSAQRQLPGALEFKAIYDAAIRECDKILLRLPEAEKATKFPSLAQRIREVEKPGYKAGSKGFLEFAIYKPLCESIHASMDLERYFARRGSATVIYTRPRMPPNAAYYGVTSALWVVDAVGALLGFETPKMLAEFKGMKSMIGAYAQ